MTSAEKEVVSGKADVTRCIQAVAHAPVPHRLVTVSIPVDILGFEAAGVMSIYAYLPLMSTSDLQWGSLQDIARYLSAFSCSPASSESVRVECQEILNILAELAKKLLPFIRSSTNRHFFRLLSCVGQSVFLKTGVWAELCGISAEKAVVRFDGRLMTTSIRQIARVSFGV